MFKQLTKELKHAIRGKQSVEKELKKWKKEYQDLLDLELSTVTAEREIKFYEKELIRAEELIKRAEINLENEEENERSRQMRDRIYKMFDTEEFQEELVNKHEGKTLFEIGMLELEKYAKSRRRGLITKSEYNIYRNAIEKHLLNL